MSAIIETCEHCGVEYLAGGLTIPVTPHNCSAETDRTVPIEDCPLRPKHHELRSRICMLCGFDPWGIHTPASGQEQP